MQEEYQNQGDRHMELPWQTYRPLVVWEARRGSQGVLASLRDWLYPEPLITFLPFLQLRLGRL